MDAGREWTHSGVMLAGRTTKRGEIYSRSQTNKGGGQSKGGKQFYQNLCGSKTQNYWGENRFSLVGSQELGEGMLC